MEEDYIYDRYYVDGVKIEEISGGARYKGKVWTEIARQIYCENGKDGYRDLGHFNIGAPFLYGEEERISISHTEGCYVVATLKVPEGTDLSTFSEPAALGIDVERIDREKVMRVREKFLNDSELSRINADSVEANIIAWTSKEAMLKAGMNPGIDFRNDIMLVSVPPIAKTRDMQINKSKETLPCLGLANILIGGEEYTFALRHYRSGDFIITVARPTLDYVEMRHR